MTWLLIVVALIYLNQVLFTIYVLRVQHGDPAFIAKYLPSGWFALADRSTVIDWLAARWPAPSLLSVSVLRVQAFLELPFVMLAYLTVCRWFTRNVYRGAIRLTPVVAASYTATFCLIEWSLRNPYTIDDLVIRIVSAVVVALAASRLSEPREDRVGSALSLLLFAITAACTGYLVLVVYDTALLYNLGHLGSKLSRAAAAVVVLAAVQLTARRYGGRPAGARVDSVVRSFGWLLVLFFVPALSIRYGLSFGARPVAAIAFVALAGTALALGVRESLSGATIGVRSWLIGIVIALGSAATIAYAAFELSGGYPETRLLAAGTAFLLVATGVCAALDRIVAWN
ncbi:MAG TPA: hypothetical protein VG317_12440 [Pseudonocardiaceae bacterium]|nr:hypothetical protein [Pseudonocardiaceae bacterium]